MRTITIVGSVKDTPVFCNNSTKEYMSDFFKLGVNIEKCVGFRTVYHSVYCGSENHKIWLSKVTKGDNLIVTGTFNASVPSEEFFDEPTNQIINYSIFPHSIESLTKGS